MRAPPLLLAACLAAWPATRFLTVAGLGGEPDYEQRFAGWAQEIDRTLKASGGEMRVETLSGPAATRARVQSSLEELARSSGREDALVVILIGHGTYDGVEYKFNLPGPDLSATELAGWLDRVPAVRQLVVNTTSASGGALDALRRPNRVVITATRGGHEKNATVFGRYWVEALRDSSADTDKSESISALEAFRFAERKTADFYASQQRIATEHPVLEDGAAEEVRASSFALLRFGAAQAAAQNPAKRKLLDRKEELERQIDRLKFRKAAMPTEEYRKQLSALLLDLARTQEELER
jgi:hypothetical protein